MENIDDFVEKLAQDTAPIKPAPHPFIQSLQWLATAVIYLAVLLALTGLRPDLSQRLQDQWFVAELATLCGICIVTTLSTALLAFPDLHQKPRLVWAPVWGFTFFVLVLFFSGQAGGLPPLPTHSFECTLSIALIALLPAAWTFYTLRRYASTHYRLAGSIALLSSFSIGALWLRLHETTDSIVHVIEWHYLPMLGIGFTGLWLGKRLLRW